MERIANYTKYNIRLEVVDGCYLVTLEYPMHWKIKDCGEGVVKSKNKKTDTNIVYYATEIENTVNPIFDVIDETIEYNLEIENKVLLFKEKIEELKTLFQSNDYDTLNTLVFKFENKEEDANIQEHKPVSDGGDVGANTADLVDDSIQEVTPTMATTATPIEKKAEEQRKPNTEEAASIDKKIAEARAKKNAKKK